eukprot:8403936-Pyramimonas_sp.AAC.1
MAMAARSPIVDEESSEVTGPEKVELGSAAMAIAHAPRLSGDQPVRCGPLTDPSVATRRGPSVAWEHLTKAACVARTCCSRSAAGWRRRSGVATRDT